MWRGISLANKCLILFGVAVVVIVLVAMLAPLLRMNGLVGNGQLGLTRQLVEVWTRLDDSARAQGLEMLVNEDGGVEHAGIVAQRLDVNSARRLAEDNRFLARALQALDKDVQRQDILSPAWRGTTREYRYARALRDGEDLIGIVTLTRQSPGAVWLLVVNLIYVGLAGLLVLLTAVALFYVITRRVILGPVRSLRLTAEEVREGNLGTRSDITTGDEFQELAETFNLMLEGLQTSQDQLRAINAAMDVRLNELAEANMVLYETAKLKGEFLANVSHELRTPLNSVVGFAELLLEIAQTEADAGDDSTRLAKRIRYLDHIVTASRNLLEMINSLLEMAKIEAGRLDMEVSSMSLQDACEALLGLIHPLADKKGLRVQLEIAPDVPVIRTDVKKFQQIVFNLLSNAVKFLDPAAGETGQVTLRAERLAGDDGQDHVRISVIDNGPGIPAEEQKRIFEKFHQLDAGHTREHGGTGLGLAICKELAGVLQGEIQVVSDIGRGSMFSLILPLEIDPTRLEETKLEAAFRGALRRDRSSIGA